MDPLESVANVTRPKSSCESLGQARAQRTDQLLHVHLNSNEALEHAIRKDTGAARDAAHSELDDLLANVRLSNGQRICPLSAQQVTAARQQFGVNRMQEDDTVWIAYLTIVFNAFVEPFNVLLIGSAILSILLKEGHTAIMMIAMVIMSGGLRCIQEIRSHRQLHQRLQTVGDRFAWVLRQADQTLTKKNDSFTTVASPISSPKSTVCAIGSKTTTIEEMQLPIRQLVPGDLIRLRAGDCVPADIQLLHSAGLQVDQSLLSGESLPVCKRPIQPGPNGICNVRPLGQLGVNPNAPASSDLPSNVKTSQIRFGQKTLNWMRSFSGWLCECLPTFEKDESWDRQKMMDTCPALIAIDSSDICVLGSHVLTGGALAIVLSTGTRTLIGRLTKQVQAPARLSAFERTLRRLSWLFVGNMITVIPFILITRIFGWSLIAAPEWLHVADESERNRLYWLQTGQYALSVAVGLTPEMLPMILNACLARGSVCLSRSGCLVKKLAAVANLACLQVLCTDKTGTLTESTVQVQQSVAIDGRSCSLTIAFAYLNARLHSSYLNPIDKALVEMVENLQPMSSEKSDTTSTKSMQSNPSVQTAPSSPRTQFLTNFAIDSERSVQKAVHVSGLELNKLSEVPFDFEKRRVGVWIELESTKVRLLVMKGALVEMVASCSHYLEPNSWSDLRTDSSPSFSILPLVTQCLARHHQSQSEPSSTAAQGISQVHELDSATRQRTIALGDRLASQGMLVLAVAAFAQNQNETNLPDLDSLPETNRLVLIGLLCLSNPPKASAGNALQCIRGMNVQIKVVSGDSPIACKAVCAQLSLDNEHVLTGKQLDQLIWDGSVSRLNETCLQATIFAQLSPFHKRVVVNSLRASGLVVGFLGDGINDALALKEADVGISVDSGAEIAKQAADIVLLRKELDVVHEAIQTGRIAHSNTAKYVCTSVASNFGNVISIAAASFIFPILPMAPVHILLLNLAYDVSQLSVPWDRVDMHAGSVSKYPSSLRVRHLIVFMVMVGFLSTVFDLLTFLYLWRSLPLHEWHSNAAKSSNETVYMLEPTQANYDRTTQQFQTGWFVLSLCTQTLLYHMNRTQFVPLFQSSASFPVYFTSILSFSACIFLPYTSLAQSFAQMKPLPSQYFVFLAVTLFMYCIFSQIFKHLYILFTGRWIG